MRQANGAVSAAGLTGRSQKGLNAMNSAIPMKGVGPQASQPAIIAGQHAGKPIYCAPEIYPLFQELEKAGRRGSHWARIAIKELGSLTTGHIGKNNVFVEESPHLRRNVTQFHTKDNPYIKHSITLFYAFLPGLQATIAQRPDGSYFVVDLQLDGRYFNATKEDRPGLYRISKGRSGWQAIYAKSGTVKQEKNRPVAVADACYADPNKAADSVEPYLVTTLGSMAESMLESDGFDLHFTPGKRRLGNLVQYNPLPIKSAHGPAVQLAQTMSSARNTAGVNWVAEYGGSAILTQAMKMLAAQGITLEGHSAYLYHARTSPGDATRLAHQLKLTLNKDFAKTGFDLRGGISMSRVAGARLKAEEDRYNTKAHYKARAMGVGKVVTVLGVSVAAGSTLGGAYPALAAITAAVGKVAGTASVILGAGTVAQHVIEPHAHKFKRIGKR